MEFADIALLIIAGGQSSRMGQDKLFLRQGETCLLESLLQKAAGINFREVYICGGRDEKRCRMLAERYGVRFLPDREKDKGPMEGLRSGLASMKADFGLAVDMPLWDFKAAEPLLRQAVEEMAVIPTAGGRYQPLAGLYRRAILPQVEESLRRGEYKLGQMLAAVSCLFVPVSNTAAFFNLNTPSDWRLLQGRRANAGRPVPLVTVTAPAAGTGKTTFIERLLPLLQARGLRAGVVKSDSHGYELDESGKDSYRFKAAGAAGVAVVSQKGYFIEQRTEERLRLEEIAARLENVDLVFIESRSRGVMPKIALWRGGEKPALDDDTAALFVGAPLTVQDIAAYDIDDVEKAVELVLFLCGLEGK